MEGHAGRGAGQVLPALFPAARLDREVMFSSHIHTCASPLLSLGSGGAFAFLDLSLNRLTAAASPPRLRFQGLGLPVPFPRSFQHADQGLIFSLSSCLISHQRGCCVSSSSSGGADQGSGPSQAIITSRPRGSVCGNHGDSGHTSVIISLGRTGINGKQRCLLLRPAY